MIVVKLKGGLGNQMFQYAFARSISKKSSSIVKLDISFYNNNNQCNSLITKRSVELLSYNIQLELANKVDLIKFDFNLKSKLRRFLAVFFLIKSPPKLIVENTTFTFRQIPALLDNIYFDGYWQALGYFNDIEEVLHEEFTLKKYRNVKVLKLAEEISNCMSVSVHFRRGDYVEKYSDYYHILSLSYYYSAIDYIRNEYANVKLFVFSDDIEWCKKNVNLGIEATFISNSDPKDDLYLMSICKHNIIANSTFSWWGAWLNRNHNKICVAPSKWFKTLNNQPDFFPSNWVVI